MPRASLDNLMPLLRLCTLVVLCCGLASAVRAADIDLLDGSTLEGGVRSWQDGTLEVETADGRTTVAAEEILRIRFGSVSQQGGPNASVEFVDGSVLPIEHFTAADGEATIHVPHVAKRLDVSTDKLAAVHLLPPTPTIAADWQKLRQLDEAGDLIVIRKDEAVDHLAGRLGDVTDTHVLFYLDEDEYRVDRSKVDGLVYYHARLESFPDPVCVLRGSAGLKLVATSVRLEDEMLLVRTSGGIELAVATAGLESADFSGGKITYLSALTPRSVNTTPLVAFPASADLAARMVEPVVDRGFFSPEALLRHPRYDGERIIGWELKPHRRAVGMRSRSEVVYSLPEGFSGFRALAGIDGTLGGRGNVHLSVFGDDRLLWEQAIDGSEPPATIEAEIDGVRRLRILVDYGAGGDVADRLYLCEARITK